MRSIVASGKMLLSDRRKSQSEEQHDEPEKQARIIGNVRPRYLKVSKFEKQKILDEFICATGYHRKHAIRVLKNKVSKARRKKRTGYPSIYHGEVVQVLEQIWEIYGHLCSKRLQPFLPEAIRVLERCQEIELAEETKDCS